MNKYIILSLLSFTLVGCVTMGEQVTNCINEIGIANTDSNRVQCAQVVAQQNATRSAAINSINYPTYQPMPVYTPPYNTGFIPPSYSVVQPNYINAF